MAWYFIAIIAASVVIGSLALWARHVEGRIGPPSERDGDPVRRFSFFFFRGGEPPNR